MAINFKQGVGMTLSQSREIGATKADEGVVAGQVVHFGSGADAGKVLKGSSATLLTGFAINNQYDGDVIASGSIGVQLLSGLDVIETDQADTDITLTNFPVGTLVYGDSDGNVTTTNTIAKVIGEVVGVNERFAAITVNGVATQGFKPFLAIKLKA